jgi:hypothetical protein
MNKERLEETALRQLFKNKSNCYADTGRFENDGSYSEGKVIQAMTEDCFINTIKEWQLERMYSEEEVEQLIHRAVHDSHCRSNRVKHANSNECAAFVNEWLIEQFKKK